MTFHSSKKGSDLASRLKQIRESKEKNQALLQRVCSKSSEKVTEKVKKEKKPVDTGVESCAFKIDQLALAKISNQNRFYYDDSNGELMEVNAIAPYINLASIIAQMKGRRSICIVLTWPVGFEWPGLSQVLANRILSTSDDNATNMRIAQYPYNQSTNTYYRKTRFHSTSLVKEAQNLIQPDHAKRIPKEISERHHAFLAINSLENLGKKDKNPTIKSLVPMFDWNNDDLKWTKNGESYLKDVRSALRRAKTSSRQDKIDDYAKTQDNPELSEDGIFCIGKTYAPSIARKALLNYSNKLDLIILDARQSAICTLKNWRKEFAKLSEHVITTEDSPPLLFLCDSPLIYADLKYKIESLVNPQAKKKKPIFIKELNTFHLIRETHSIWEFENKKLTQLPENKVTFHVEVSGKTTMDQINRINKYANTLGESNPEAKIEILKLGGFLKGLIDNPVGHRHTRQWVKEHTEEMSAQESSRISSCYDWSTYKLRVQERLKSLGALETHEAKMSLATADKIACSVEEHTEVQLNLGDLLKDAWARKEKTLVILPARYQIEVINRLLNTDIGPDFTNTILILTQNASATIDYSVYQNIVFAGKVDQVLDYILLSQTIQGNIYLYSSAYSARRIDRVLKTLISIPEFSKIHSRANEILKPIEKILSSMAIIGSLSDDTNNSDYAFINDIYTYDPKEFFATITLQHYGEYYVGKYQRLIKYNPNDLRAFSAVDLEEINEGDQILLLDDELRDLMEKFLLGCGKEIKSASGSKDLLMAYFTTIKKNLEIYYQQKAILHKAQEVHKEMCLLNKDVGSEITVDSVRRWIRWILEHDQFSKEELQSNSAQNIAHFKLFAEALHMSGDEAEMYYRYAIQTYRGNRIQEGRYVGFLLTRLLTNADRPESMNLSVQQYNTLIKIATDNVYTIVTIDYNNLDVSMRSDAAC